MPRIPGVVVSSNQANRPGGFRWQTENVANDVFGHSFSRLCRMSYIFIGPCGISASHVGEDLNATWMLLRVLGHVQHWDRISQVLPRFGVLICERVCVPLP